MNNEAFSIKNKGYKIKPAIHTTINMVVWAGLFIVLLNPFNNNFWFVVTLFIVVLNSILSGIVIAAILPIFEEAKKEQETAENITKTEKL